MNLKLENWSIKFVRGKTSDSDSEEYHSLKKQKSEIQDKLDSHHLFNTMSQIDESLIDAGVNNSVAWFKKKKQSRDVTSALLSSNLRYSLNKETGERLDYAPRIKVKIPFRDGRVNCKVWDQNKELIDIDSEEKLEEIFQKGTKVGSF